MRNQYTLRPIVNWPGELTNTRKWSPFYSSWSDTQALLDKELDMLKAKQIALQMAVTELDFRRDGQIRADARPRHPGVILAFNSQFGPLQYACDTYDDWQANVRAIALSLEALRKVDRYGVSRRGQQYTGWKALRDGEMSQREAEEVLESYGGEKGAIRATHPDQGGNVEEFKRVQEARRVLSAFDR